ncbi:MAG: DUF4115 domain-containing protein [Magnetococcus sp. YQC-5]
MSASPRHESDASPVTLPDQTGAIIHPTVLRAGEMLRRLREEKGLSLEEMAKRTRIRSTHLQALESGRIDTLPGQVFVLGFLRLYARNLECANTELIEACVADLDTTHQVLHTESFVSVPAPRHRPAIWMAISGLLILVGLFVAYEYHMAEISSAIGLPAPPNAAPLRVGEAIPTRSSADPLPQTEDKSMEDASSGKGVGLDDPSLWPATDSSPERVTYVTSGQRPEAPVPAKPDAKLASRLESKPGPKLESKLDLKPTTAKPDAKPEVTVSEPSASKPDTKSTIQPEATVSAQSAPKPDAKPVGTVTAQSTSKPDTKPTTTVTGQPASKPDTKPTAIVTAQSASKPDIKPTTTVTAPSASKTDIKPTTTATAPSASKPDTKPTATVTAQSASKTDIKSTTTVTAQPASKPDARPETDLASQPDFDPDSAPEPTPDQSATTAVASLFNSVLNRFFSRDTSETSDSSKTLPPAEESVSDPMPIMNDPIPAKSASENVAWNAVPLTRNEPPPPATTTIASDSTKTKTRSEPTPPATTTVANDSTKTKPRSEPTPPATTTVASDSTKTKPPVAAHNKKWPKEIKERYPEPVNGESDLAPESPNAVSLLASELVWVQIKDQNGIVKDMVMQPGFLFHIPEGGQFTATLGNAAAVRVRVGAKELPLMGEAGSMIEGLKLNPDQLRKRITGP